MSAGLDYDQTNMVIAGGYIYFPNQIASEADRAPAPAYQIPFNQMNSYALAGRVFRMPDYRQSDNSR